jgi:uncharacterized membrane protein YedE/YeeE
MNHAIAAVKIFRGGAVAIFGVLVGVWLYLEFRCTFWLYLEFTLLSNIRLVPLIYHFYYYMLFQYNTLPRQSTPRNSFPNNFLVLTAL